VTPRVVTILRRALVIVLVYASVVTILHATGQIEISHPESSQPLGFTKKGWRYIWEAVALTLLAISAGTLVRTPPRRERIRVGVSLAAVALVLGVVIAIWLR
jgi:hypothetical protein